MSFIISQSDIQEMVLAARYRADMTQNAVLSELFRNNQYLRTLFGRLLHLASNCHFDPGAITSYQDVIDEMGHLPEIVGEGDLQYIIHELYLSIRSTVDPWIDRGWLYEVSAIDVAEYDISCIPLGFSINPLLSPRIQCQHSDLVSSAAIVDFLNTKAY